MNRINYFRRQFTYEHWANGRVLESMAEQDIESGKPVDLMAHILICQGAWLTRMEGRSTEGWDLFPKFNVQQCQLLLDKNHGKFDEFLSNFSESSLDKARPYRNSMGEEFSSTFESVLTHLLYHGTYHRGQIATLMRQAGKEPVRIDFVFYDRGDV